MLNMLAFVVNAIIFISAGYIYGQSQSQFEVERSAIINAVVTQLILEENQ